VSLARKKTEHAVWLRLPSDNAAAATPFVLMAGMAPHVLPGLLYCGMVTRLVSGAVFQEADGYNCFMNVLHTHFAALGLLYSYWPAWCCSPLQYWRKGGVLLRANRRKMETEIQLALESSVAVNCFWQSSKATVGSMQKYASHGKVEDGSAWSEIMLAARKRIGVRPARILFF
jgi:hypothetical protein